MLGPCYVLSVCKVQPLNHFDAEVVMLADELGGNLLGGAGEEGLGEVLGGLGGYGSGLGGEMGGGRWDMRKLHKNNI